VSEDEDDDDGNEDVRPRQRASSARRLSGRRRRRSAAAEDGATTDDARPTRRYVSAYTCIKSVQNTAQASEFNRILSTSQIRNVFMHSRVSDVVGSTAGLYAQSPSFSSRLCNIAGVVSSCVAMG